MPIPSREAVPIAVMVAAIAGAITPLAYWHLPESINSVANSSGPWVIVVFSTLFFLRVRGWRAAALGIVSFLVMDAAFYVVHQSFGRFYPHHYLAVWVGVGIVIGPVVGLCASWMRSARPMLQAIAVAAPSAVLIGEGIYMLERLPGNSTLYAHASVAVGAVLFAALAALRFTRLRMVALSFALCTIGALAFFEVYGLLPLVLHNVVP
jgi:hypothetical protein